MARLRLASVLLDEKNYAEAVKLLNPSMMRLSTGLCGPQRRCTGAQGKMAEARAAYQPALGKIDAKSAYPKSVQMKLDGLGERG